MKINSPSKLMGCGWHHNCGPKLFIMITIDSRNLVKARKKDCGGSSEVSSVGREWRLGGATSVCHHLASHCSRYCHWLGGSGEHLPGLQLPAVNFYNREQLHWCPSPSSSNQKLLKQLDYRCQSCLVCIPMLDILCWSIVSQMIMKVDIAQQYGVFGSWKTPPSEEGWLLPIEPRRLKGQILIKRWPYCAPPSHTPLLLRIQLCMVYTELN